MQGPMLRVETIRRLLHKGIDNKFQKYRVESWHDATVTLWHMELDTCFTFDDLESFVQVFYETTLQEWANSP